LNLSKVPGLHEINGAIALRSLQVRQFDVEEGRFYPVTDSVLNFYLEWTPDSVVARGANALVPDLDARCRKTQSPYNWREKIVKMAAAGGSVDIFGDLTFNMAHGFLEGLVRGLRSTFLTDADYASLKECTDMKGKRCKLILETNNTRPCIVHLFQF